MYIELGQFLKARRSQIRPEAAGVASDGKRRRVSGLRREEVARLAGVSESYYRDLEQGVAVNASPQVLDSLARVFALTPQEHEHMRLLAQPTPRPSTGFQEPAPGTHQLIGTIAGPVLVTGVTGDILAWNASAHMLFASHLDINAPDRPQTRPNLARLIVLDPVSRGLFVDWPAKVRDVAAHLRLSAGAWPSYPGLSALIGELGIRSDEFARVWAQHAVSTCGLDPFTVDHPVAGVLTLEQHTMVSPTVPEQTYMVFTAQQESGAEVSWDPLMRACASPSGGEHEAR
ncbi:helix-turn-helix domain-containing protein [Streptomyces sp. ISL-12]|uniref:helix-turn-helix transcriptional regulator n=1 Tax=Streptomyces sp. ISL-12 TaxID=2819177 RepID=UPI001BE4E332|nr:helix-turn-helix transcriptional regulator [Streptomyces sp. ISL-12]MBT2412784.1 helix-turn-helix domain-containing protein [Streptomyces sp. ISL-12]